MNLWNNAIKFTEKGVIAFTAKYIKNNIIKISLKDSGIGQYYFFLT